MSWVVRACCARMLIVMCCGGWLSVIAGLPESFQRERQHRVTMRETSCIEHGPWLPEAYINNGITSFPHSFLAFGQ